MIHQLSRAQLLSRGAKGTAALLVAGVAGGAFAAAASADVYSDNDLAYLRLLIGAELLGADFYASAVAAQPFADVGQGYLKRALFNEGEHYTTLAALVSGSNQSPATAADIDFTYPKDSFASVAGVTKLAIQLESLFLGAYLGAVDGVQNNALKQPLARIAANQAQHLAVFNGMLGHKGFDISFPNALSIADATAGLAAFTG